MSIAKVKEVYRVCTNRSVDACPHCNGAGFSATARVLYGKSERDYELAVIKYVCGRIYDPRGEVVLRQCEKQTAKVTKIIESGSSDLEDVLRERERTHGSFAEVAELHDAILGLLVDRLPLERPIALSLALDMIVLKLARLACGDPFELDHYVDIAGYAKLAQREIEALKRAKKI